MPPGERLFSVSTHAKIRKNGESGDSVDTRDMELFLTIARCKSISKTAETLFMSQSTVTTRLQRLERDLGYAVFDRLPAGVELTEAGLHLLPLAEQVQRIVREMSSKERFQTPTLRVMSGRAFVSTDVPSCLSRMVQKINVRLQVQMGLYDEMVEALTMRRVDFCFLGEPIYHPHVRSIEFPADAIDLVVPANHPFIHHFPGLCALNQEPFIAFSREGAPFRERIFQLLGKAGVFPPIRMELDSIDGIKAMIGHGLGVSFLPRRTLADARFKGCTAISMNSSDWTRPTFLAYPEDVEDKPWTQQFIQVVRQHFATISPAEGIPQTPLPMQRKDLAHAPTHE
ncbi:MAG: LysR family transcriptional regulator [Alicyclobacillaceae bacterium]|nr:LysR family transcriptional regulator [Alicyclobacillaceae bacterium]